MRLESKMIFIFDSKYSKEYPMESAFMQYIVNRFLCRRRRICSRKRLRRSEAKTNEHRNLKFFLKSNHESDNSIR